MASNMGTTPIVVSAKNMSLADFMKDIAAATDSTWERKAEQFVLTRGRSKENTAIKNEARLRGERLEEGIKTYLESNKANQDWSQNSIRKRLDEDRKMRENMAKQSTLGGDSGVMVTYSSSVSPSHIFLYEAASKLSPEVLGSIGIGKRVVFSSQPTKAQVRLPYQSAKVREFIESNNRLSETSLTESGSSNVGSINISTDLTKQRPKIESISKLLIAATAFTEGISLQAIVVGPDGQIYDQPSSFISFAPQKPVVAPADSAGEISLSEENYEFVKLMLPSSSTSQSFAIVLRVADDELTSGIGQHVSPVAMSPKLRSKLSDPEKIDPISLFPSEVLLKFADLRKKSLIACIPDRSVYEMAKRLSTGKIQVKDFYQYSSSMGLSVTEGDTLVVSPLNVAESDRTRVNRSSLGRLIDVYAKQGWVGIKDLLAYASTMPNYEESNLDAVLLKLTAPGTVETYRQDPNLVKLYASTYTKLNQLNLNPAFIDTRFVTAYEKGLLETVLYKSTGFMMMGDGMMVTAESRVGGARPALPNIYNTEPTEMYPDGIPHGTTLNLRKAFGEGVLAFDAKGNSRIMTATDLGLHEGFDWKAMNPQATATTYEKFKPAELADHVFLVDFGKKKSEVRLRDASVSSGAAAAFASLPNSIKDKVAKGKETTSRMKFGTVVGQPVTGTPPPR